MKNYDEGWKEGRDWAIKVLCEMIDRVLVGERVQFDASKPHSAAFERLIRRLDNKLH